MSDTALQPRSAAESLTLLERELGGRSGLIDALITAPASKDVRYLLGQLADPANAAQSLAVICARAKLLPGQLLRMLEEGTKLRARVIAGQIIAQGTPAVVRDVMQKAAPYEDDCTYCGGIGTLTPDPTAEVPNPTPAPCPHCRGACRLRYDADGEARKLALDMAGLTTKGGGISIVNQNANVQLAGSSGNSYEVLQEALDKILYGRGAIEGDVVSPPEDMPEEET